MGTLVTLVIGAFIGWNFPQPEWARRTQVKMTTWLSSITASK